MTDRTTPHQRLQAEVLEIAEVLAREQGKSLTDVWEEALSLHRVRYDTYVIPPPEEHKKQKKGEGEDRA